VGRLLLHNGFETGLNRDPQELLKSMMKGMPGTRSVILRFMIACLAIVEGDSQGRRGLACGAMVRLC